MLTLDFMLYMEKNADIVEDDDSCKIHPIGQMELMDAMPMNVMMVGVTLMVVIITLMVMPTKIVVYVVEV